MGEFEDKLNSILSSPETMEQIMALAGSIAGGNAEGETPPPEGESAGAAPSGPEPSGLGSLFSGLDPAMLGKLLPLIQEYQSGNDEKQALLNALKPFLKQESQAKVEKAIQITKLSHVIRSSMQLFRGDGHV